jgi:hypothetical protein
MLSINAKRTQRSECRNTNKTVSPKLKDSSAYIANYPRGSVHFMSPIIRFVALWHSPPRNRMITLPAFWPDHVLFKADTCPRWQTGLATYMRAVWVSVLTIASFWTMAYVCKWRREWCTADHSARPSNCTPWRHLAGLSDAVNIGLENTNIWWMILTLKTQHGGVRCRGVTQRATRHVPGFGIWNFISLLWVTASCS